MCLEKYEPMRLWYGFVPPTSEELWRDLRGDFRTTTSLGDIIALLQSNEVVYAFHAQRGTAFRGGAR